MSKKSFVGVYALMKKTSILNQLITAALIYGVSTPLMAINSVATVNVKVNRFLSVTNTSAMNFGEVSINSLAGAVIMKSDGTREYEGGVLLNSKDSYSPAKFIIEGAHNADYTISFPEEIVMTDGNGNSLIVDQIQSEIFDAGENDSNGLKELVVGARLNLEAFQATGDYSGNLLVEVEYQ